MIEKWRRTVRIAFAEYYGTSDDLLGSVAPAEAKSQYSLHLAAISRLEPIIELRNKVAHGQWLHALARDGATLHEQKTDELAAESLLSLRLKDRLAASVADGVNDLVVSRKAHDRDLSKHQTRLENTLRELDTRSYGRYLSNIRARARRTQNARRAAVGKAAV